MVHNSLPENSPFGGVARSHATAARGRRRDCDKWRAFAQSMYMYTPQVVHRHQWSRQVYLIADWISVLNCPTLRSYLPGNHDNEDKVKETPGNKPWFSTNGMENIDKCKFLCCKCNNSESFFCSITTTVYLFYFFVTWPFYFVAHISNS